MGAAPSKEELLYQQVQYANHAAVKSLRRNGASLEWIDKGGRTPLLLACSRGELLDMVITLLNLGADLKAYCSGTHGGYPLHYAAKRGLDKTVTLLLSRGANPLAVNDDGQTPLDMARSRGHVAVVRLLEEQLCVFAGMVRELSGPGILESLAANLITKNVWAVVLPQNPYCIAGPPEYELAIYRPPKLSLWNGLRSPSTHPAGLCNVAKPRTVITLAKAEMEEPDFSSVDPVLCIWDKVHKMKIKLSSHTRGDKEQLKKLYGACKGMLEGRTQSSFAYSRMEHKPGEFKQGSLKHHEDANSMLSQQSFSSCMQPILYSVPAPFSGRFTSCSSNSINAEYLSEDFALALALNESIQIAAAEHMPYLSDEPSPCSSTDHEQDPNDHGCDGRRFQELYTQYNANIMTCNARKPLKSVSQRLTSSSIKLFTRSFREVCDVEGPVKGARGFPLAPPFFDKAQIHRSPAETDSDLRCIVCWDAPREGACIPCGHMAGCMNCVTKIYSEGLGCPVCRSVIEQVIKVYTV